jgi:hypothetical protein
MLIIRYSPVSIGRSANFRLDDEPPISDDAPLLGRLLRRHVQVFANRWPLFLGQIFCCEPVPEFTLATAETTLQSNSPPVPLIGKRACKPEVVEQEKF